MPIKTANKLPAGSPRKKVTFSLHGRNTGYMVNRGGKAYFYKIITEARKKKFKAFRNKKYMILGGFYVSQGLRKLGIEVNAGGGMFKPRAYPRKTFRGLTFDQIKRIQRKY